MKRLRLGLGIGAVLLGIISFLYVDAQRPSWGDNLLLLFGPTLALLSAGAGLIAKSGPDCPAAVPVTVSRVVVGRRAYHPEQLSTEDPQSRCALWLEDTRRNRSWVVVEGSVTDYPLFSRYPPSP